MVFSSKSTLYISASTLSKLIDVLQVRSGNFFKSISFSNSISRRPNKSFSMPSMFIKNLGRQIPLALSMKFSLMWAFFTRPSNPAGVGATPEDLLSWICFSIVSFSCLAKRSMSCTAGLAGQTLAPGFQLVAVGVIPPKLLPEGSCVSCETGDNKSTGGGATGAALSESLFITCVSAIL